MEEHIGVCVDRKSCLLKIKDVVLDGVEVKPDPMETWLNQMEGVLGFLNEDPCI